MSGTSNKRSAATSSDCQRDHTLSGFSCTFQSVSEALAEPACRSPVYAATRPFYGDTKRHHFEPDNQGHTSGLDACNQSVSGGFRDVGSVISSELIAVCVDCSRFVPVRVLDYILALK